MNLFSISNISKSFEQSLLFEGISFGMEEGDRVGLIGRNGIGKSTLLHIIAGKEEPDTGVVAFNKTVRTEFLNQLPSFDAHMTVLDIVMSGKPEEYGLLRRHEELCNAAAHSDAEEEEMHSLAVKIDEKSAWNLRSTALGFLHSLGVTTMDADVMTLSGGQRKRVALARALLSQPDLLILDEPTNHLDARIVQWLQDELQRSAKGVLLVTHDRYFLDAVSSRIVELDQRRLFSFDGNYEKYLERKEAMIAADDATQAHERNKLRHELAWLQKGAKARRTKQQSRINWIEKMQVEKAEAKQREIELEVGSVFLGGRIIDAYNISKTMRDRVVFRNFEYSAAPGDKIGFIGPNGAGKSTLLNVLAGIIPPDTGSVRIGDTVTIGYFRQEVPHIPPTQTVIGAVRAIAEYIDGGVGREKYISARELLERFRFPAHRHGSRIETLSGGERRRLELCRVLMANPNVLLLDEPTNDFDLATLSALEEYLVAFKGVLLVVSHDRAFLDKTVEFIYAFEDDGTIKQYPGNYTSYLHAMEQRTLEQRKTAADGKKESAAERAMQSATQPAKPRTGKGLSYKEQKELDEIGPKLEALAEEQAALEHDLANSSGADHERLSRISTRLQEIAEENDTLTERWFALEEKKSAGV